MCLWNQIENKGDQAADKKTEHGQSRALEMLDDDVKQAEAEAALAQEREQLLQLEVGPSSSVSRKKLQCVKDVFVLLTLYLILTM